MGIVKWEKVLVRAVFDFGTLPEPMGYKGYKFDLIIIPQKQSNNFIPLYLL